MGNVVGSNIANLLLVTGLAAVVGGGLIVARRLVRVDGLVLIAASLVVTVMAWNGVISRLEGLLLLAAMVTYLVTTVVLARRSPDQGAAPERRERAPRPMPVLVVLIVAGLVGLVVGARLLVDAASSIASAFGVSELVIGLTVVAVGTSAPEIATSVLAAARGQRDLAVGNAVGSSIVNLLGVLGAAAVVASGGVPVAESARTFDLLVMTAAAIISLPMFASGQKVSRTEGGVLVGLYAAYTLYLVLDGLNHQRAEELGRAVVASLVLALVAATIVALRQARSRSSAAPTSSPS